MEVRQAFSTHQVRTAFRVNLPLDLLNHLYIVTQLFLEFEPICYQYDPFAHHDPSGVIMMSETGREHGVGIDPYSGELTVKLSSLALFKLEQRAMW